MKQLLNCPNCGAPIEGEKCEYCGTVFLDFAAIQLGAPSYVKFKMDNAYILARLVVTSLQIEPHTETVDYIDSLGRTLGSVVRGTSCGIKLEADAVAAPGEHMVTVILQEEENNG